MSRRRHGPFPWVMHPVWRGIGCFLLILIPILSWILAEFLLARIAMSYPEFADTLMNNTGLIKNPVIIKVAFALVISFVFYLIFSIFGSLIYSALGGPEVEDLAQRTRQRRYR